MDKKNTTIGVLLLAAALALMFIGPRRPPPQPPTQPAPVENAGTAPVGAATQATPLENAAAPIGTPGQPVTLPTAAPTAVNTLFAPVAPGRADENVTLGNEFIEVRFTKYGGAIADVALKQHLALKNRPDPLVLNAEHYAPTLAFTEFPGADFGTTYTLVSQDSSQVVWRTVVAGSLEITRTYAITRAGGEQDPYSIRSTTTLRNLGAGPITPARLRLNLGTAQPFHDTDTGQYLGVGLYDGDSAKFIARDSLSGGGFLSWIGMADGSPKASVERLGPTVWATVENQFFAAIVAPKKPAAGVIIRRVQLPLHASSTQPRTGVTGDLLIDTPTIAAGGSETLEFSLYTGPKEYHRLVQLGQKQDLVMQWGNFIGFFAKLLLTLMTWLHGLFDFSRWAWGFAIVATTVVIRTLLWPLTGLSTRAAKRMAKIQVPLKEIQEKYKDNRIKQQEETMKLFKAHKVNPLGGCLPLLVQMPIFFGLFTMLRSASELRFAEFLWIPDLSAPEQLWQNSIGFGINIMVLLMGATQFVQMRLTPTPATDNASVKMMKYMPFFFTAICYNFSSGLALYWTASNLFSIFQQWVTNRSKDPVEITPTKPGAAERAKPVKDAKVVSVGDRKKKK